MSSFAFLNFFVGLTSLDFELFWCLMLFVLFCCLTSLVLCTLSKKCVRLLTFFYRKIFVPFYFCFQVHSVFMFCVFMELFQILLWHHFRTLILIGRTPWGGVGGVKVVRYEIEKRLREVYTIVKLPNIELLIAAGDVKEKKEDLKKIARESSRPGVDHRFMFAPLKVRSFNVSV